MATARYIKDKNNIVIGWVSDSDNMLIAVHRLKGVVGRYVKSTNITTDKQGKIYCYGDGLDSLIREVR